MKTKNMNYLFLMLFLLLFSVLCFKETSSAKTSGTGTVTASKLNVRQKASTSSATLGQITNGTQVDIITESKDSTGTLWYQVSTKIGSKTVTGYVSASYIEMNPSYSFVECTATVKVSTSLNIRKSASTTSTILANVKNGHRVTVIGTKTVSGVKWVKLRLTVNGKEITGYTLKTYVTYDKTTTTSPDYILGIINSNQIVMYSKANTYTPIKAKLSKSQEVIILGNITVDSVKWYKVKAKMNDTNVYGYVVASKVTKADSTVSSTQNLSGQVNKSTKAYKVASSVSKNMKTVSVGQNVTVLGELTVNGSKWYKVKFKVSNASYTAYILASCIRLEADAWFTASLDNFPASYHSYLKALHEKYPEWKFVAVDTGLDWNTVIENESMVGKNTIQSNLPKGGIESAYSFPFSYLSTASGAYDWSTDTYTLMDGSNWYTADTEVIQYYMDPRNYLTESTIWALEALSYDESQSKVVVSGILANSFMSGSYSCVDSATNKVVSGTYANLFMEAGKLSGVSPYFLAARSKQELGVNGSGSSSGTYTGYKGIYNFFNIGANDSSTGQAIANGLKWASTGTTYLRPWTSIEKAVLGGAEYIATSYINKGQDTNYFQKFNVVYSPFYSHQYMTNVMAPTSESKSKYSVYSSLGILDETYVFRIPVYKNMPQAACKLPASSGNPNSYAKSVTVKNGSKKLTVTPSFHYQTTSYTMVVANEVDEITISSLPISKYATISGTGTYTLQAGKTTTITLKCTAQNKTVTTYTLKVSRLSA